VKYTLILALMLGLACQAADARTKRSQSAIVEFKLQQPCPATGAHKGPCKGYVIDHIKPLACGGADAPGNMQWQTVADAKAKDKWERKACGK
jgi:hypothetical protein